MAVASHTHAAVGYTQLGPASGVDGLAVAGSISGEGLLDEVAGSSLGGLHGHHAHITGHAPPTEWCWPVASAAGSCAAADKWLCLEHAGGLNGCNNMAGNGPAVQCDLINKQGQACTYGIQL